MSKIKINEPGSKLPSGWALPIKYQGPSVIAIRWQAYKLTRSQALKLDRAQAIGYSGTRKEKIYVKKRS